MNYIFRETAVEWLRQKEFSDEEIEELQGILNVLKQHREKEKDAFIKLPKHASKKISAVVYMLGSINNADGNLACFEEEGFINIPEDARKYYEDDLQIEELEGNIENIRRVKFGRDHSSPKRRGSTKDERY